MSIKDLLLEHYLNSVLPQEFMGRSLYVRAGVLTGVTWNDEMLSRAFKVLGLGDRLSCETLEDGRTLVRVHLPDGSQVSEVLFTRRKPKP
jgi:hypothetical protein